MTLYYEPEKYQFLINQFLKILKPPKNLTVSQWADAERVLPPGSPEPGPWRSSRTPYFIPVADAFDDPRYSSIIASCGSQMGKTEMLLNVLGKRFDYGPRVPALFVFPNEKLTRSMSNDRIEKMMLTAKGLYEKLDKGHKDKVTEKFIAGIRLGLAWSGSSTELASHPCGLAIADEIDRYADNTKGEGDPVTLIKARLKNYYGSKFGGFSTPTVWPGSKITLLFYGGTMGKWSWSCPGCGEYFIPDLKTLKWDSKSSLASIEGEAFIECPGCKFEIRDKHKLTMNQTGRYEYHEVKDPEAEELEYVAIGPEPPENKTASFWVSGLASPWQTFGEIAAKMAAAYRSKDQEIVKATINTYLGQFYEIRGQGHDWTKLEQLIGEYEAGTVPEEVQLITMGADVQGDGIYWTIRGWGHNQESWKIDSGFLPGETEFMAVWSLFGQIIERDFNGMKIKRAFIDSGFNTQQVYLFSRRFPGRVFPSKGQQDQMRPLIMAKVDLSITGKIQKGGIKLFHVDTNYFKTWLYSRFKWDPLASGAFHLDSDTTLDYLKQVTAEQYVVHEKGGGKWEQVRADNHYLDAETYCVAAAHSLAVHSLPLYDDRVSRIEQKPKKKKSKPFVKKSNPSRPFIRR